MYEIPQQLEYKEKIVFGLTFTQLFYVLIFLPIAFGLFFKLQANLPIRIFLSSIPSLLAIGFMFFDLQNNIKNWYTWLKFRNLDTQEKLEKALALGKIKDNLIISNNKKIAVIKVESINFSMKTQKEKETISYAFQKFLNSIDFPIQILMTTGTLDLDSYLDSLKNKMSNENHKEMFDSYKNHMENLIEDNSAMNRDFYVVIPETSDISIQIDLCEDRLHSLNLKTSRMKSDKLKMIFSKILSQKSNLYPDEIKNSPDFLNIDGKFHKIIYAYGYPRSVENGFLDRLVSCSGDFDFSLHINPHQIEQTLILLNRELQKQRADLYAAKLKNQLSPSLEIKYQDTKSILSNLQKGNEKLFDVSLYINCRADSLKELDLLTRKIESELNSLLIIPRKPLFRMLDGLKSCLPLAKDFLKITRNITTPALSAFFPFTSSFSKFDESGVWLGLNKNNIPIIKDIFNLSNPNGIVLAQSGGGKSYFCKLLIIRYLLNGVRVMVIDPQGEYGALVSHFKGQRIDLSRDSKTIINPLDLMGHDYIEKRLSLMDLMKVMLGDLTDIQRAFIDKAINRAYKLKGITTNPDTWNNEPPILGDLMKVFKQMETEASKLEKTTINSLASRLDMYVSGVFGFMNRQTNLDFNNNLVCFDIGNLPSQVKPSVMFLVLDYIYMKMKSNLNRKILLIDEAWSLLSKTEEAGYIFEIVKTCRKFNLGLLLINQEVEGLLDSKAGKSVLANSAYTILMKQKPAVIDSICRTFHLSENERIHLLTANIGEGLLMMEDDHSELKVIASPAEHRLITTNPDELKIIKKEKVMQNKVNIKVDPNKRFFHKKYLKKDEIKFLLDESYQIKKYKNLLNDKMEEFVLQPRHNESFMHLFMTHNISEFLEKNGIETKLYTTKKPDIVFEINGKKYAIEIETGSVLSKVSRMKEKLKVLNQYEKWFFVITDKNKVKKYKKFGDAVDKRYLKLKLNKVLEFAKNSQK
ncbi:ATP-binding protein [Candidatus Pacearchaeota archaeon]|nr:ATP-binding protein [Candidatus Pacearchaeota archaeon]